MSPPIAFLMPLLAEGIDFLKVPPYSTIAIMGIVIVINTATTLLTTKMTNLEENRRLMIETKKVQAEMMEATKTGNQRRIDRAQKKQQELMAIQSKNSMDRMKISLFTFVPLILLWQFIWNFFGGGVIAYFPFDAPYIPRELNVGNWYILCSFACSILISRVFGITFEIDPAESAVNEDEE